MDEAKFYRAYEEQEANSDKVSFTVSLAVTFIFALIVGFLIGIASAGVS